jgi:dATP pyrophosphohydrolase
VAALKRPESVLVVVHDRALNCLLLERAHPTGFWQSITGSLEWGETPAAAAAREVIEETGLQPGRLRDAHVVRTFPILPEWRARYGPGVTETAEHRWYLEVASRAEIALKPEEHRAYRWLPLPEAIGIASSWTNREALEALAARVAPP